MAAAKKPEASVKAAAGLKALYRTYRDQFPEIADTIATFNEYKREIPPRQLPQKMKDHVLDGPLKGIRECHLDDDVLLLYTHKKNEVRMLFICEHADLYGRRGRQVAKRVKALLED